MLVKDLVGQVFGDLVVLSRAPNVGRHVAWNCRCSCGRELVVTSHALKFVNFKNCGCKKNIINMRFGRLLVLKESGYTKDRHKTYECLCDCGNTTVVSRSNLRSGTSTSCGCFKSEEVHNRSFKDITGQKFGRLLVLSFSRISSERKAVWNVRCDCGVEKEVTGKELRSGHILSCGCLRDEKTIERNTTHGMSKTKEYSCALAAKRRELSILYDSEWTFRMECEVRNFQDRCVICGKTQEENILETGKSLHKDHILPLSKKHGLKPGNVVMLCGFHNESKNDKDLKDLPPENVLKIRHAAEHFYCYWNMVVDPIKLGI